MLLLPIKKLKDFNRRLFLEEAFDGFGLSSARFVTSFVTSFDGASLSKDSAAPYVSWSEIKPLAAQLVRGKAPGSFSIVLVLPEEKTAALLAAADIDCLKEELPSFFLNLQYRQEQMTLTTGISDRLFRPGLRLAQLWDASLPALLAEMDLDGTISMP